MDKIICYKLVRLRKNNTLGSLFINRKAILPLNKWIDSKFFPTKGYAERFGWHCTYYPYAPHLKQDNQTRVWVKCEVEECTEYIRPKSQGGIWVLANKIKIIKVLSEVEVKKLNKKVLNVN